MGDAPIALIPTIASSDAPLPPLSVIYKEDGSFESYWYFSRCVDLILVDTMIIANAPVRYLVAGMGDALSTKFEAEACKLSGNAIADCFSSELVIEICNLCYKILMEYGVIAKESAEKRLVTPALDKIVGVNTLLSGLGAANDVAAAAHAIHDGFTILEETHKFLHGEKVGFCTIAQLLLEGRSPILINEVIDFCYKVGLPISLSDLNITNDIEEKISKVAGSVSKWIKNEPLEVTEKSIFNSIMLTDSIGENFKKGKNLKEII